MTSACCGKRICPLARCRVVPHLDVDCPDGQLSQYVYIGLFTNKEVWRLDPKTGAVVTKINVAPAAPYGLVIDKQSNVWAAGRETGVLAPSCALRRRTATR